MKYRQISIAIMVIIPMLIITSILLYFFSYYNYSVERERAMTGFSASKQNLANQLAQSLALPIRDSDKKLIETIVINTLEDQNVYNISVNPFKNDLQELSLTRDNNWIFNDSKREFFTSDLIIEKDINFLKEKLGKLKIVFTTYIIEKRLKDNFEKSIRDTLIFDIILVLCLSVLLWVVALKPLKRVEQYAVAISSGNIPLNRSGKDSFFGEIQILFSSLEKMVTELNKRYDELKKSEEAQSKWTGIFRNAEWGVVVLDADAKTIEIMNHAFAKIHGYEIEELMNKPVQDVFASKFQREFPDRIRIATENGHHIFESINIRKDNSSFPAIIDITTVKDHENRILYHAINVQDITERKKSENLIREQSLLAQKSNEELEKLYKELILSNNQIMESEARLTSYFSSAPNAIIIIDTSGVIIDVNPATCLMVEYSREEIIHNSGWSFIAPESMQTQNLAIEKLYKDGSVLCELILMKKDETRVHVIETINRLPNGTSIVFCTDITKRKLAEEALKKSENKYRLLFENMNTGFALHQMIYDENGNPIDFRFLEINPAFEKLYDYPADYLIGKTMKEIDPNAKQEDIYSSDRVAQTGLPYSFQYYDNRLKKHFDMWMFSSAKGYFATIVNDITEKKMDEIALHESNIQLESALTVLRETQLQVMQHERLRALGQLASGIAHDINNSLMPILGYADLLLHNKGVSIIASKPLNSIKTASLDIRRTIERMKEFYRPQIEEGLYQKLDTSKIIETSIEFTKHRWKDIAESEGKVIKIISSREDNLPVILGNESEIREALTNLIINACDGMPDGGNLNIKSYSSENHLVIEICDTGMGMDDDTLNHCMDPFFTTKRDKGTGLGLSMVYGILQRHKGFVKIDSKQNIGTSVKLFFPVIEVSNKISEIDKYGSVFSKLKMLCIEDDLQVSEIIKSMLENRNHEITIADSGKAGIEKFRKVFGSKEQFDLVITDLGMPFMDGKAVSESIKQICPEIPIILMTGWGSFLEAGSIKSVDYILRKPVSLIELEKSIDLVINKYRKKV